MTVGIVAQGLAQEVDVDGAGQRVGHHEHGRGEVVSPDQRVDPPLEVAVAREHRRHDQVVLLDLLRDVLGQKAAVADARGAPIAHHVEAKRL